MAAAKGLGFEFTRMKRRLVLRKLRDTLVSLSNPFKEGSDWWQTNIR
jgi:hypothetical protein